jgi:hypothetical protein
VLWGAPRIRGELLKQGFAVAQSTNRPVHEQTGWQSALGSTLGQLRAQPHAADCRPCGHARGGPVPAERAPMRKVREVLNANPKPDRSYYLARSAASGPLNGRSSRT